MTRLELEIFDDVVATLNKIRNINDAGIELIIPEGSILFENVLNLKLIKKHADRYNQTVHFMTDDVNGTNLIGMVEEGAIPRLVTDKDDGFTIGNFGQGSRPKFDLAFVTEPLANIVASIKNIRMGNRSPKSFILPIVIALGLVVLFHFTQSTREANVKLIINSQPLTKSVTIKVKSGTSSNPQSKILAGINLQNTLEVTKEVDTTGEKIVGEKAKGVAKIFNKTSEEKEFKKGQILIFENNDKDYNFVLDDDVTVPAATEVPPSTTWGVAEVEVTASQVGKEYNIEKGETLEVYKNKKSEVTAEAKDDFTGGKSETKKSVAQADLTKLQTLLAEEINKQADASLKTKVANSQSLVNGSFKVTPIKEEANHKVGDEEDKVSMTKSVTVEGLVYQKSELDRVLDELLKEYIPEGFVLSSKDREINVEVLGNATSTVLNSTEADIQVTIKSFIVPNLSEDEIKKQLAGKSTSEAQKILGSVRNIETYEFNLAKGFIPIFTKVPNDIDKINVEIVKK